MIKTYITFVLDRSGSMQGLEKEIVGAFNEQVETCQDLSTNMDTRIGLITFSTLVDIPFIWNAPVDMLSKLQPQDYKPDGLTALYDAVDDAIIRLQEMPDKDDSETAFLIIIVSDGHENNSKKIRGKDLADKIKTLTDTGRWTFTYVGSNQDLSDVSRQLNINLANTMSYNSTKDGVKHYSGQTVNGLYNYMAHRGRGFTASVQFFAEPSKEEDSSKTN